MKIAVYPGTFDPITHGHLDILVRSLRIFDLVFVAVAPNPNKRPLFDLSERVDMVKLVTKELGRVEVEPFEGLLVDYVKRRKAHGVLRGLRAISDFEFEFQMALVNRKLDHSVETLFLMPSEEYAYITSSIIKEVAGLGGPLEDFLHPEVARRLRHRLKPDRTGKGLA
ncbi:MAG: pantetheine-phosphate adenylyltransferase [Nitrospirales bacterium]